MLVKNSDFSLIAIIMLSAGIGANTAVFSVVNAVLLKPLPVAQPDELVSLYTSDFSGPRLVDYAVPAALSSTNCPPSKLAYSKPAKLSLLRGFPELKFRLHAERPKNS